MGDDVDMREAVLLEALTEIAFSGLSEATLKAAAARAGASPEQTAALFPDGVESLVEFFSQWADARMEDRVRQSDTIRVRDKVAFAVRARIETLTSHKEAARRVAAFLALPQHAALAAKLLFRSVDAMWRATGDQANDFNYYTKRALLAGVYGATLLHWFADSSDGHVDTWVFLDRRIDDVMKIQKFRGTLARAGTQLPDPFGILARLRTAGRR